MSANELNDNRGRKVLGTVADRENGKYCIVCTACDGEYVDFGQFTNHILLHRPVKVEKPEKPRRLVVPRQSSTIPDYIVLSSDSEYDTEPVIPPQNANLSTITLSSDSESENSSARTRELRPRSKKHSSTNRGGSPRSAPVDDSISTDEESDTRPRAKKRTKRSHKPDDDTSDSDFEPSPPKRKVSSPKAGPSNRPKAEPSGNEQYHCKFCQQGFESVLQVNMHRQKCVPWLKTWHCCNVCSKRFPTRSAKNAHHRKDHQKELPERCAMCPACFATKTELATHQQKQHITGIVINCLLCNEQFSTRFEKDEHVRTDHPFGEYECEICGRCVKTEHGLKEHQKIH